MLNVAITLTYAYASSTVATNTTLLFQEKFKKFTFLWISKIIPIKLTKFPLWVLFPFPFQELLLEFSKAIRLTILFFYVSHSAKISWLLINISALANRSEERFS